MRDEARVEALARVPRLLAGELLVDLAAPVPQDQLDAGLLCDMAAEEGVGQEDHPVRTPFGRHRLDHLRGIGRGAAGVGFGLHRRAGVDVGDHGRGRVAVTQFAHVGGGDRGGERTARLEVRDQHGLAGRQDLRALGHEVHAGQHDQVGVAVGRGLRQRQRVAGDVGHAVEDFRRLVAVGHDHRAALALEDVDRVDPRQVQRPLQAGQQRLQARAEFGVPRFQLRAPARRGLRHGRPPAPRGRSGRRDAGRSAAPVARPPRACGRAGCARSARVRCRR